MGNNLTGEIKNLQEMEHFFGNALVNGLFLALLSSTRPFRATVYRGLGSAEAHATWEKT